jgi:hypothetical protein
MRIINQLNCYYHEKRLYESDYIGINLHLTHPKYITKNEWIINIEKMHTFI